MKKFLIIILLFAASCIYAQPSDLFKCNNFKFEGKVPFPWAIDGQIQDWETVLGNSTNNPIFPYGNSSTAYDSYGLLDPDSVDSKNDLRVNSVAYDSYNVFFYFRRLDNSNGASKAFYFIDTNIDGLLNKGEPVIIINFNGQNINKLSLGVYNPQNPEGDLIGEPYPGNPCFVDGWPVAGKVNEVINSSKAELLQNEIFAAAITENGYGVELAVPWRLISSYKYFTYHLALQKGGGNYNSNASSDNAGGCRALLSIIGSPDFEVSDMEISSLSNSTFRIDVTFKNLTPTELEIYDGGFISFKNIVQNNDLPVDENQFTVTFNNKPFLYYDGTFLNQPIRYNSITTFGSFLSDLAAFESKTISIYISFPPNNSVSSALVEFQPASRFKLGVICAPNTGGGGKPINPVGFTIGEEEEPTRKNNNSPAIEKNDKDRNILIYPNPSTGNTNVILPTNEGSFEIMLTNYTGQLVMKWSNIKQGIFKMGNLKPGFYILTVRSGNGKISVRKLLVN